MPSSMQPSRHEQGLAGDAPVVISVGRAEARLQRELDKSTAALDRVTQRQHLRFARERASVRSRADRHMREVLGGVKSVSLPCMLDRQSLNVCSPSTPWWQRDVVLNDGLEHVQKADGDDDGVLGVAVAAAAKAKKKKSSKQGERTAGAPAKGYFPCANRYGKVVGSSHSSSYSKEPPYASRSGRSPEEKDVLPRGFPTPFDASGFQCAIHWAETSIHEVILTALGPRSERERRGTEEYPNRLLLSVACYLLHEVLSRDTKFSTLWSTLQPIIFKAVFAPRNLSHPEDSDGGDNDTSIARYPRFEKCHDFVGLRLWSDAFFSSLKANTHLSGRNIELQEVVQKSQLVLRLAQRQIDRVNVMHAFRAWQAHVHRSRTFRDAATAYFARMRRRIHLDGCFLRWRRVTMQSQVLTLKKMVGESEVRLGLLESTSSEALDSLSARLVEEQKRNTILEKKKEALKSQLADNHVQTLRAIHSEVRQLQLDILTEKKHSKRWERLAKTFTCRQGSLKVPPQLRKGGQALQRIENDYATAVSSTQDRTQAARRCLEAFLLDWVNILMRNGTNGGFWRSVTRIDTGMYDGDFDSSALLKFVRVLDGLYTASGVRPARSFSQLKRHGEEEELHLPKPEEDEGQPNDESCNVLFTELTRVLGLQTLEGLFPPLLLHCLSLGNFFTPSLFCRRSHPTAMLWVLSSLFVGYTRLACGTGPLAAERDLDPDLRCSLRSTLGSHLMGLNASTKSDTMTRGVLSTTLRRNTTSMSGLGVILSTDTVIKKGPRQPRPSSGSTRSTHPVEGTEQNTLTHAEGIVDTNSDLEVYLGLVGEDDDSSSGSSRSSSSIVAGDESKTNGDEGRASSGEVKGSRGRVVLPDTNGDVGDETASSNCSANSLDSGERRRRRRVRRKAKLIPPVSAALCSATQQEYVEIHQQTTEQQRVWMGLARVVSSLVVRFRILDDVCPPQSQPPQGPPSLKGESRSTYNASKSSFPSERSEGKRVKVRKSARLLPSSKMPKTTSTESSPIRS